MEEHTQETGGGHGAAEQTAVCIAGMHRSGTSLVARLLHGCGLYLGPEGELVGGRADNPDGFFENKHFVAINEGILRSYGAGWDIPPELAPGWQSDECLGPLKDEAARLLADFEGRAAWGWKDPRNSLTLPFWREMIPQARVVVCLRNPLDVALSLRKRGNSSFAFGFNLWAVYHERLLESLPEGRHAVTHYDAYFRRPQAEMRRVLDSLGLHASDQMIAQVRAGSLKDLRHSRSTQKDLAETGASPRLLDLYARFCRMAGWGLEGAFDAGAVAKGAS